MPGHAQLQRQDGQVLHVVGLLLRAGQRQLHVHQAGQVAHFQPAINCSSQLTQHGKFLIFTITARV